MNFDVSAKHLKESYGSRKPWHPISSFEHSCVKIIHGKWFPTVPFKKIQDRYSHDERDTTIPLTWFWYESQIESSAYIPTIDFEESLLLWNKTIADLFSIKDVTKTAFYRKWVDSGTDLLVMPLVGKKIVFGELDSDYEDEHGLKSFPAIKFASTKDDKKVLSIMLLSDWAEVYRNKVSSAGEIVLIPD